MTTLALLMLAMQVGQVEPDRVRVAISPEETRRIELKFSECLVKKHPVEARHFVLDDQSDDKARRDTVDKLTDSACFDNGNISGEARMAIPPHAMGYLLADALVRAQFGSVSIGDLELVAPLIHSAPNPAEYQPTSGKTYKPAQLKELAEQRNAQQALHFQAIFGECVVRMDQSASLALLKTSPASAGEDAAFTALSAAMGQCLPEGRTLAFNREAIRGSVAQNYFRLAVAPRLAPPVEPAR